MYLVSLSGHYEIEDAIEFVHMGLDTTIVLVNDLEYIPPDIFHWYTVDWDYIRVGGENSICIDSSEAGKRVSRNEDGTYTATKALSSGEIASYRGTLQECVDWLVSAE